MNIVEILAGVVAITIGAFAIFLFTLKGEVRLTKNSFQDFLGTSKTMQKAYGVFAGIGFCLVGLVMILQGFGYLR